MDPNTSHTTKVVDHKNSTKQRLDALDGQSTRLCDVVETFEKMFKTAKTDIREMNIQLDESWTMYTAMNDDVALLPDLREKIEAMRLQLRILHRVVDNGQVPTQEYAPRLKILELHTYRRTRDAKEVENFLFDIEQYFLGANIEDEARRITTATIYLGGDAKLLWQTKYTDIQANRVQIDMWDLFKEVIITRTGQKLTQTTQPD
ncbi:Uncharacterized protein Adt_23043 [Abeliophyllum distichum]|uniref:Uncharacterized protein n=1 Tax=Abeliophyllum distichum TaxID=126358 RepID=A0ABD1S9Q7_9LAMI